MDAASQQALSRIREIAGAVYETEGRYACAIPRDDEWFLVIGEDLQGILDAVEAYPSKADWVERITPYLEFDEVLAEIEQEFGDKARVLIASASDGPRR